MNQPLLDPAVAAFREGRYEACAVQCRAALARQPDDEMLLTLLAMAAHQPDAAILDIDLNGHMSFPVADALARLNVPFLWLSGSSRDTLPEHYRVRPFVSKPLVPAVILGELTGLLKRS